MSGRPSMAPQPPVGAGTRSAGATSVRAPEAAFALRPGFGQTPTPVPDLSHQVTGTVATSEWPLKSFIELGALASAVPCARLHTRQVLWEWNLEVLTYATELIVSELVTNSLSASEGLTVSRYNGHWVPGTPPIRLWLLSDGEQAATHVWDGSDLLPQPQEAELEAEGGRGLLLVTSLNAAWGIYRLGQSDGKITWAVVDR